MRFSISVFFHDSVSPKSLSIPLGLFWIFFKNLRKYSQLKVHHWCCWHWWQIYRRCCWYLKSANSWFKFAIENLKISEICESKNVKSANFFRLNHKSQTRKLVSSPQIANLKIFHHKTERMKHLQTIWDRKSHICKLWKILGPQITNPQITTLAEGPHCKFGNLLFAKLICETYLRTILLSKFATGINHNSKNLVILSFKQNISAHKIALISLHKTS